MNYKNRGKQLLYLYVYYSIIKLIYKGVYSMMQFNIMEYTIMENNRGIHIECIFISCIQII